MKHFNIERYMSKNPYLANSRMLAKEAYGKMKEKGIRHFPVIEDNDLVGIVSERDLRQVIRYPDAERVTVWELMSPKPYVAVKGTPLVKCIKEMREKKYGCVVVVDETDWILGIFTTTDALGLLQELMSGENEPKQMGFSAIEEYLGRTDYGTSANEKKISS